MLTPHGISLIVIEKVLASATLIKIGRTKTALKVIYSSFALGLLLLGESFSHLR